MKTEVVSAQECAKAVALLRAGEIVALPTETVYGLAADALNPDAVAKVFEAKERPRFDPLIVHLPHINWLERVANVPTQDRELILNLAKAFWPGPFTMVLPRQSIIPDLVTAGLDTVAVRISANPVFSLILRELDRPLAAPSANRFGRISPTAAEHVLAELDGRIPLIVNGGPTEHGIESTIVAVREGKIDILRLGPVIGETLAKFAEVHIASSHETISAPGQLPSHYAPKRRLVIIDDAESFMPATDQRVALLAWKASRNDGFPTVVSDSRQPGGDRRSQKFIAVRQLSETQDLREAAANLFRFLRELDALKDVDLIVAELVPDRGLGAAMMDRLRRAASDFNA